MTLIVGSSIATVYTITSRENETFEYQRRPSVAIKASEILARGGPSALKSWLESNRIAMGDRELFIIGPDGRADGCPKAPRGVSNSSIASRSPGISGHRAPHRKSSPRTDPHTQWS
jgi:hypothetical protein